MDIPVNKNEEYVVDIIDYGYEGEGIAKIKGYTLFVVGAVKGERCRVHILKALTSHGYAKLIEVIEKSENRQESDCDTFGRCGGCDLRHMTYEEGLVIKRQSVQNLIDKNLNQKIKVGQVYGMGIPYYYRNKAIYPIGRDNENRAIYGIYARRSHEIIPIKECMIQSQNSQGIAEFIVDFIQSHQISIYDEETQKGIFRNIMIREGFHSKEIMCIWVLNEKSFKEEKELVEELLIAFPRIKTIVKNINDKNTNVVLGEKEEILYGNGYIYDELGEYLFKISPKSFYQINPIQTENLYNLAIEQAQIQKGDVVVDLYCGIGTIGIFASRYARKVYGIEIIEDAILNARENAQINGIENIEFMVGDVEEKFDELIEKENLTPDIIFVDPPRKGLDKNTIGNIKKLKPKKVIYISCNPATLMRDLKEIEEVYEIMKITPVDMFPYTKHVECICLLELK